MNQKTAESVEHLVKPCYEAIKTIAGERECPECKRRRAIAAMLVPTYESSLMGNKIPCDKCNGAGRLRYDWKPKWNELAYLDGKLVSIRQHWVTPSKVEMCRVAGPDEKSITIVKEKLIPILPWEMIEGILKGMGYHITFDDTEISNNKYLHKSYIWKNGNVCCEGDSCKSRQEATMLAVDRLAKELK